MRKVMLITAAAVSVAVLSRLPAMPFAGEQPAGPVAAALAINPLELMQQAVGPPVQEFEDFTMVGDRSAPPPTAGRSFQAGARAIERVFPVA
jgi:hypothetical protein